MTQTQKEKKLQYILDYFDDYIIDVKGNLFNTNTEVLGDGENSEYAYIGSKALTPDGLQKIHKKMAEMILQNLEDWELVFDEVNNLEGFKNKKRKIEIYKRGLERNLDFKTYYKLIGELGYRKNIWENYEQVMKEKEKKEKEWEEWWSNIKKENDDLRTIPTPTPNPEKEENQNNSPSHQEQPEPTDPDNSPLSSDSEDNPLPTSTDTQNQYNLDKDKLEIDNNPNLTNSEQKDQTNELLKIIVAAELLVKEQKSNPQILSQLLEEKRNNNPPYQILNKNNRVDKVIEALEKTQTKHQNKSIVKDNTTPSLTTNSLIGGGIATLIFVFLILIVVKKKKNYLKK